MTTNAQRVTDFHAAKPEWAQNLTAHDWDIAELIAEQLDIEAGGENVSCEAAPEGRYCVLHQGHDGNCVTYEQP